MSTPDLTFNSTVGAQVIGGAVTAVLYGINLLQTYAYYQNTSNERKYMKPAIAFLFLLDTVHIALVYQSIYHYTVTNFAKPLELEFATKPLMTTILVTVISNFTIRCLYTVRIWKVSKQNITLVSIATSLNLLCFALGLYTGAKSFQVKLFTRFHPILGWTNFTTYGIALGLDGFIALVLCFSLYQSRTESVKSDLNSIVNTLIIYCINTGLISAIVNLTYIIVFALEPNNFIFLGIFWATQNVYYCSLLSTLNGRRRLREKIRAVVFPLHDITPSYGKDSGSVSETMQSSSHVNGKNTYPADGITVNHYVETRVD